VTSEFAPNPRVFPQICGFFWISTGPGPKVATGGEGDGLGRPLVPSLLAVNSSSVALFFLIIGDLGLFIDVSCPS